MGAITGYIDVAQLTLYAFWAFFAGLVIYLQKESKREGFPLQHDDVRPGQLSTTHEGWPEMPKPKEFRLSSGEVVLAPADNGDKRDLALEPAYPWPGAPLQPTGDPLVDGVGPASWAARADVPDYNKEGEPKLQPMRRATHFSVADQDPDPRGFEVVAADRATAGTIADIWVDTDECLIRYLEVDVNGLDRNVLVPMTFCQVEGPPSNRIRVTSITADQFTRVPLTADPETVTRREEDRIMGYYGGGRLYAMPDRREPLL